MKKITVIGLLLAALLSGPAFGMDRFDIVTTEQMKAMLDMRSAGKTDFLLVNSLDEIIFRNSSIPGSINVPWSKVGECASRLGDDKDQLIVIY